MPGVQVESNETVMSNDKRGAALGLISLARLERTNSSSGFIIPTIPVQALIQGSAIDEAQNEPDL
jgi:hypothetical protein